MRRLVPIVAYDHQIFAYQRFGGVSRYFTELASRIPAVAPFSTCIVAPLHINEYLSNCAAPKYAVESELGFRGGQQLRGAVNRITSSIIMRLLQPSLVHWTYFNPTALPRGALGVATVHDMIHELFPGDWSSNDSTTDNKRRNVERANHVICVSENTKADLIRLFGTAENKISVIYHGFSRAFRPVGSLVDNPSPSGKPYLLYVGHRGGYKGFSDAVRAYAASSRLSRAVDFVVFGGPELHAAEVALFLSLGLRAGQVRRLTGDDQALAQAYRGARAFVYPSRYEGFGIPPLEAMGCGCPVVCADTSSLPEVVGDAALLFDPADRDALREALESVCFDDQRRAALIEAGRARSSLFSWDRCARETAALYTRLLAT